jgi:hypothetical protein
MFLENEIRSCYLALKQEIYHDNLNHFLKKKLSSFEHENDIDKYLKEFCKKINNACEMQDYKILINNDSVDYHILPKSLSKEQDNKTIHINFLSNMRSHRDYELVNINYFIDPSIEVLLVSALWTKSIGKMLDGDFNDDCLGNRIDQSLDYATHPRLFKPYIYQYKKWRNQAIDVALDNAKNHTNIALIALDIYQCFYALNPDFESINDVINNKMEEDQISDNVFLNGLLENIHSLYHEKIQTSLAFSHYRFSLKNGLPIGLPSSNVLANYQLTKVDQLIKERLKPIHYGRYVDDMLLIVQYNLTAKKDEEKKIFNQLFLGTNLLEAEEQEESTVADSQQDEIFHFMGYPNICINPKKIIIHYYDSNHSLAGLTEFKRELDQQSSEFRFLPISNDNEELSQFAYELQYKGSINKLRNLIGISENETELSKYLSRRIIEFKLTSGSLVSNIFDQLLRFFKGRNYLEYFRLWEKIFSFLIISNKPTEIKKTFKEIYDVMCRIKYKNELIQQRILEDCLEYLKISLSLPLSLLSVNLDNDFAFNKELTNLQRFLKEIDSQEIIDLSMRLRSSNLFRHDYVSWPLINYSDYKGNLVQFHEIGEYLNLDLNYHKIKYSPRYIHIDEYSLFRFLVSFKPQTKISSPTTEYYNIGYEIKEIFDTYNKNIQKDLDNPNWIQIDKDIINGINTYKISIIEKTKRDGKKVSIGLANMKINTDDIIASYHPLKKPNTSAARKRVIFELINNAITFPSCDLLVFPEVSIPFSWLPMMIQQSRVKGIGMVFGLEHIVRGGYASNYIVTALPFSTPNGYSKCLPSIRLKNYYSPQEEYDLSRLNLNKPNQDIYYERFIWKNIHFSCYNCYELTDIHHRGIFRSLVDMVIAVEWNSDVNYYSNIIESCSRDLHCYLVQSNTSQFGDSRVTIPVKTEKMNLVRFKGGNNAVLVKQDLDFSELIDFQLKKYCPDDDRYKPKPAGYETENVFNRK